jgi:MFS family permease
VSATAYLFGAVAGALVFGYATDRPGRRKLFFLTLALYLSATRATGFSWSFGSYTLFRTLTGCGIGGEYAAINSAVDELIPARIRGHVDLVINSTFWIGAAVGSGGALLLTRLRWLPPTLSWRFAFGIGAVLGLGVLFMRRHVPESPRWLLTHGCEDEADRVVAKIEERVERERGPLPRAEGTIRLHVRPYTPWSEIRDALFVKYKDRAVLGFALMAAQAFFYNAVLFTYGLVLLRFYGVRATSLPYYLLPLAFGNFWARW